ncbi:hypothetical protein DH2020_000639 [Rehmannia glutinosa]|uniref:Tf2-1-like SH3-like domain-containing protein n=1 Tax=Rehmannia glutinosa TaxID=99300 RepID=A0ABR0XXQ3_REHGL
MLRACMLDFGGGWERHLPLIEFAYNNSYQSTIGMAPYEALSKIRDRTKTAQDRLKSYAYKRRKDLQFEVKDKVFLKVAPLKGVVHFGKKGKLRPRYIEPFEILDRTGDVAYRVDPSHIINPKELDVSNNLSHEESPIAILGKQVPKLRNREVPLMLVQWSRHGKEEATWEREEEILAKYLSIPS